MPWKYHPVQLDKLEAVARSARPGPWVEDDCNVFSQPIQQQMYAYLDELMAGTHPDCATQETHDDQPGRPDPFICTTEQRDQQAWADAKFIAAFNPETCLRLIAWVRSLERNEYRAVDEPEATS